MKRVGILTTFFEVASGYSLVSVAETQIRMLLEHDYEPTVFVQEGVSYKNGDFVPFREEPPPSVWNKKMVDLRPVVPFMHLVEGVAENFDERVEVILNAMRNNMGHLQVCITHDIVLQQSYKEHNVAMREYAKERPDLLWLHWIHSYPTRDGRGEYPWNCRNTPPPGYVVYPNTADMGAVYRTYGLAGMEWRAKRSRTGHSIDLLSLSGFSGLTRDLARASGLLDGEISAIYPIRLDGDKQPEKIIRLFAGVREAGYEPRLLIVDWQSAGDRFQQHIDELLKIAKELGIEDCVFVSSRLDDRCNQGVPREVVAELMSLTNVYVHPSRMETYSLVAHEAILYGNLVVLNHDLPAMLELFGNAAIYMDFGSSHTARANTQEFWNEEAKRLISELVNDRVAWAKTTARLKWSPKAMWKEFEPLLYLQPVGA